MTILFRIIALQLMRFGIYFDGVFTTAAIGLQLGCVIYILGDHPMIRVQATLLCLQLNLTLSWCAHPIDEKHGMESPQQKEVNGDDKS